MSTAVTESKPAASNPTDSAAPAPPAEKPKVGTLSREQIDFFSRNGYLPYQKVLTDEEIGLYRAEYDREFALAEAGGRWRNLSAADGTAIADQKKHGVQMLQVMQMSERNIHFMKLIYDARILDVVQDLIGPNIMLFHDQALFKPAFHGGAVTWHQDNSYWQCRPANLVSCWLTLDDVAVENGAMQVVPGSHLTPVWHTKKNEKDVLFNIEDQIDKSKVAAVPLPAGACMFHHCQTLHYTQTNTTDRQRRAFAIHFMTPGTVGGNGTKFEVGINHPMLRATV